MQPPSTPSSSSSSDGDIPNILPPSHTDQFRANERAPSGPSRLLCDCHNTVANGQALHESADPSRLGVMSLKPCLECALFVARRGDLVTKDDLCLSYHGSCRCSHCAMQNHDCSEIYCATLREAVDQLFGLCFRYFYEEDSQSLHTAKSIFELQQLVLSRYNKSDDRYLISP